MYSGEYDACDVTLSIVSVYKYSTNSMEITWFKSYDLLIIIIQCFSSDIAKYIEDIIYTRRREDMTFIFEWWKQYFTNERSEWVKYCF